MNIQSTLSTLPSTSLRAPGKVEQAKAVGSAGSTTELGNSFKSVLNTVNQLQNEATELQKKVQMQDSSVTLEQAMVAMQKAQVGFQATLHVRNRMVQAYSDIMNMQV